MTVVMALRQTPPNGVELESTPRNCAKTYNHNIPQRALNHQTPIQALKKWQEEKPALFLKRVHNQPGFDTYRAWEGQIAKNIRPNQSADIRIDFTYNGQSTRRDGSVYGATVGGRTETRGFDNPRSFQ